MKIDKPIPPITTVSVSEGKRRTDISSSVPAPENTVHISENAAKLTQANNGAADASVVNTAKVQEIKQAISDGNFQINPEVVADRLLETVRELIQSKKGTS